MESSIYDTTYLVDMKGIQGCNFNFHSFCLDRAVLNVHLICNDANKFLGGAFVLFGSLEVIALALEGQVTAIESTMRLLKCTEAQRNNSETTEELCQSNRQWAPKMIILLQ